MLIVALLGLAGVTGSAGLVTLFVDPSGSVTPSDPWDDFDLAVGNPAINAGLNLFDNATYGSATVDAAGIALPTCGAPPCDAASPAWNMGATP